MYGERVKRWRTEAMASGNPRQIGDDSRGGRKRKKERGWRRRLDLEMVSLINLFRLFFFSSFKAG
jgi:hypothetical protein